MLENRIWKKWKWKIRIEKIKARINKQIKIKNWFRKYVKKPFLRKRNRKRKNDWRRKNKKSRNM